MFCRQCGNRINENASFCPACGAALQTEAQPFSTASAPVSAPVRSSYSTKKNQPKDGLMNILLIAVSVILILLGIGQMALMIAGRSTTAHVTGYEQVLFMHNDDSTRNPSRYKVAYEFSVKGERYTGSVTRVFEGGSHMKQTIPVRYLLIWPYINSEDSGKESLAGPVMVGAGVLILVLSIKKKRTG